MDIQFLQDNWMMAALAVVSGAMLIWSFIGSKLSGVEQADTLKATRLYNDDALIIDVREDKEFASGHIPNWPAASMNSKGTRANRSLSPAAAASVRHVPAAC
jgi:hypothetical protein